MIETIETGSRKVLGLKLCGKLHDEDHKQFVPRWETILTGRGKVRLFVEFEDFHGWDLHAAWDDLKLGLKHYSDFERIAMVGDRKWEELMASFCKPFTRAKVKYFERLEVHAAWTWLLENKEDNRAREEEDQPDISEGPDRWGTYPWYWS